MALTHQFLAHAFKSMLDNADQNIKDFIDDHTGWDAEGDLPDAFYDDNGDLVVQDKNNDGFISEEEAGASWKGEGTLILSASDTMQLQSLMTDQSLAAQTGTSTTKGVSDSIKTIDRNIGQ